MTIKQLATKLRKAAEVLDELFHVEETSQVAEKIRRTIKVRRVHLKKVKQSSKGRSYNGKHWTQTPAGKKRVKKVLKIALAAKRAKKAAEKAAA